MTRITLLGSSSGRNAGDAALIRAIVDAVSAEVPDAHFEIPTISPSFLKRHYAGEAVTPIPMLPWNLSVKFLGLPTFRSVARTDATLVFDAVLFDRALRNPLFNYLWPLSFLLPYARKQGKKVVFYNVGVGPIHTPVGRRVLGRVLAAGHLFTIRDPDSLALAREVGLPEGAPVMLTADAAFNHRPAPEPRIREILASFGLPAERPRIGINVNAYLDTWATAAGGKVGRARFVAVMAEVLDRMVDRWNASIVFFVTQHMDRAVTREVLEGMKRSSHARTLSNWDRSPEELQGVMGEMELFFGMRLHSLLLAASQLTPIVGLVYQSKVESLFRYLEIPERALPFSPFDAATLWPALEEAWKRRNADREHLRKRVETLRTLALNAATATAEVLRGTSAIP